jgi:hypothetical protein
LKFKKTLILLGVLIILVAIVLIIEKSSDKKSDDETQNGVPTLFTGFKPEEAAKIEIKQLSGDNIIEKKEGKWIVTSSNNFPADQEAVEKLLETIKGFTTQDMISRNPQKQNIYLVNDKMGIGTTVSDVKNKVLAHVYIGKNGPNFMSTYVRKEAANEVYLQPGYLKSVFDKGKTEWKDMYIFKFDPKTLAYLDLDSPDVKITCEKNKEGKWNVTKPQSFLANATTMDQISETLSKLTTNDYPEKKDLKEYKLDKPERQLTFKLSDGTEYKLLISSEDKNKFYAIKPGSDMIFSLYKYRITNIFKKIDDFRPKEEGKETETGVNPLLNSQGANPVNPQKASEPKKISDEKKKEAEKALMDAIKKNQKKTK